MRKTTKLLGQNCPSHWQGVAYLTRDRWETLFEESGRKDWLLPYIVVHIFSADILHSCAWWAKKCVGRASSTTCELDRS